MRMRGWSRTELHYGSILKYAVATSGKVTGVPLKSEFLSSFRCKC